MSVALLGLVMIQFYWIENVHQQTQDSFQEQVKKSLEVTISDLERIEMMPLFDQDLFDQGMQGTYTDFLNREFGDIINIDETIEIKDTSIIKDGKRYQFLVIHGSAMDSATGLFAENRIITKKLGDIIPADVESSVLSFNDSNSFAVQLNRSFNRQIANKTHLLNDIMVKLFSRNYFDDLSLRLNILVLDSLLKYNFYKYEIDTNYIFNIVKVGEDPPLFIDGSPNYDRLLTSSVYKTILYPNDISSDVFELVVSFPNQRAFLWKEMTSTLIASILLVLIIVFAFYLSVSTIYKQKQLSEIKNDFISNMTHELKTPISTISLACEAIQDPDIGGDKSTVVNFVKMIDQENKRLAKLVENVLQTSLLDKGEINLKLEEVRLDILVKKTVDAFQIRYKNKGGSIEIEKLEEVTAKIDRIHFGNIIYNLLDNALKYCTVSPKAIVRLKQISNGYTIEISDNGIGIKKEDHGRVFEKLYRVPTGDVHNVKGFGLGLNYVASIVKLHKGEITVESSLGNGATFIIRINNE